MANLSPPDASWPDERLVEACLAGDELAWGVLVEKHKHLVYAIALNYGASSEQAADLFQSIWLDAFKDLPKLRKPASFKSWLISLSTHCCFHWKERRRRRRRFEVATEEGAGRERAPVLEPSFAEELERDQLVREAIALLDPRCRELIHLLFFAAPPLPYKQVAERLGLATGSIGFTRGRCLERLAKILEDRLGAR